MLMRDSNVLNQHDRKLALSFGAVVLILVLAASGAASYLFSQLKQKQEDRLSGVIAVILGESISRVSFSGKYHARLFVEEMKSRVPELAFISVENKDGLILAHSDPAKNDETMSDTEDVDLRIQSLKTGSPVAGEHIRDGKTIKEVVLPYRGGPDAGVIGVVHTGINFDEVRREQRVNLFKLLILVAVLTAAAIWVILILSHHFGSTVRALATQLQGILNHAPVAIGISDRIGRIIGFSVGFEHLFGRPTARQTQMQLFAERLSDANVKRLAETDRKVFENGVPCEQELQVDIQGRLCTWNVSKFPIARDDDGKTTLICAFIHDITERKQAERSLAENEARLRTLVQTIPDLIWLKDTDGVYLTCNTRFERLYGARETDIVGKTDYDFVGKELADFFREHDRMAMAAGKSSANEEWLTFADDGYHGLFDTIKTPMCDVDGKLIGVLGISRDITERKRDEERLKNQMEFLTTLLDTIPSPVFYKDVSRRYLGCNRAFEEFWGMSRESIVGKSAHDMGPEEIAEKYEAMDNELFEHGGHQTYEWKVRSADGSEKDVIFNKATFPDAGGHIAGLVGVILDITERKHVEEERIRLEGRLLQSYKMEAIGSLAGGIAHDFNNILSAVLGFVELAKMKLKDNRSVENEMNQILSAGIRARDLVKQILAFSRQTGIKREPLVLAPLIKESMKFLRASLPVTIDIRQDISVSGSMTIADPTQIHQVIMNLCTNAAYAMKEKGGTLAIRLAEVELDDEAEQELKGLKQGPYLQLTVADTGCGIPKEIINRIFDPFFTTKGRGEGTGMGLSVVHGIVREMGGAISAYSEPGKGTTFQVLFPRYEGESSGADSAHTATRTGSGTILFVDDEEGVIVSSRGILEQLGYKVVSTSSPLEALEIFRSRPGEFNLVLTDMTMPKMTGLELSEQLLKIRSDIPIVLCTGFNLGISPEKIRDVGIKELVMKPMIASELANAVYTALAPDNV
ncbi:MAG: PAS domain-containing protein [Deltaproteobacteria bacterium]|nr:PAS domain-containing protein [Deltaproteobacteria bacterium]